MPHEVNAGEFQGIEKVLHIAGLALEIEGIVEGSDDGITVQLFTISR